ncbi:hypothetical protein NDU88_005766 [Pleurodeles waltl]|uniref:Uncharacterized protein n=1 Tax=Pleurodeles waltl TaxID=8319 RepID=A0AAV7MX98_PLEWA|nr:hypothetical protein NDU88_005766 [Pleurodeles waltl]
MASPPQSQEPPGRRPREITGSRGPIKPPIRPLRFAANCPPAATPHKAAALTSPGPPTRPGKPTAERRASSDPARARPFVRSQFYTTEAWAKSPPPQPAAPAPSQCRPARKTKMSPPCQDKCKNRAPSRAEPH